MPEILVFIGFFLYIYTSLQATFNLASLGTRFNIKKQKCLEVLEHDKATSINFNTTKIIDMTKLQNCLQNACIYVGSYYKYNNSSLYGKWLNLSDYSDYDELRQAMYELHSDESEPEFMLSDYEGCSLFEKLGLIGESFLSPEIYEIGEQINESEYDIEVFEACLDCLGSIDFQSLLEYVNDFYYGEYANDIEFVEYLYENDIPFNLPSFVVIDWEATARNIMYDYFESNGHYFKS